MGNSNPGASKSRDARRFAPVPVANVANELALELFDEVLKEVRAPYGHKVVPQVTVLISYRIEEE